MITPVSLLHTLRTQDFTWIECDRKNADRIIRRFMKRGWWFCCSHAEDRYTLIFSSVIDVTRDIRDKLQGIDYELT